MEVSWVLGLLVGLFVLQNSVPIRSVFPLEKSLCTGKQRARTPDR